MRMQGNAQARTMMATSSAITVKKPTAQAPAYFGLAINAMLPISQNLTGGRVEANYRFGVNLNYSL